MIALHSVAKVCFHAIFDFSSKSVTIRMSDIRPPASPMAKPLCAGSVAHFLFYFFQSPAPSFQFSRLALSSLPASGRYRLGHHLLPPEADPPSEGKVKS